MTNEMRELERKAYDGDAESQFNLGRAYAFGNDGFTQNVPEGLKWLELSGNTYPGGLRLMIGIYLGGFGAQYSDPKGIIKCFGKLVDVHKDLKAMVDFGAIYSGDPDNRHINPDMGGLPELASYTDPVLSFKIIDQGIKLADKEAENPLGEPQYSAAHSAYHTVTRKMHKPELKHELEGNPYFKDFELFVTFAKKVVYASRALVALKERKGTPPAYEENMRMLLELRENILNSAISELTSFLKAVIYNREMADGIFGKGEVQNFLETAANKVHELRDSEHKTDNEISMVLAKAMESALSEM